MALFILFVLMVLYNVPFRYDGHDRTEQLFYTYELDSDPAIHHIADNETVLVPARTAGRHANQPMPLRNVPLRLAMELESS